MNVKKFTSLALIFTLLVGLFSFSTPEANANGDATLKVRVLETTDIHGHIMNYDYYADKPSNSFGLVKAATLIKELRQDKNTILVDNGDVIQGNPFGEYVHKNLKADEVSPIIAAMNLLDYDAGTLGNHEFNYGLDFLDQSLAGATFPVVSANVFKDDGGQNNTPYYKQYEIVNKEFVDEKGQTHIVKVGLTGFVPPQIMTWDAGHLTGKVVAKDIVETANAVIPQMKAEGAELIVAIAHSGIETAAQAAGAENVVFDLTKIDGIDVVVSGHQHGTFPGDNRFNGIDAIDNVKGTINGVPVVMPKNWASHVGVIDLDLQKVDGKWAIVDSQSLVKSVADSAPDQEMVDLVKDAHEATLSYVRSPVGKTTAPINSFFALVQDDPSIQIVNAAQKWFVEDKLKGTEYADLPILSVAAPFKAGGRNGVDYYTNIPTGALAIKNVGDLYLYDNTVKALKITGAEVIEWLEMSAGQFHTVDPTKTEEQPLVNEDFRSYNFDVFDGIEYQYDVTKAPKYDTTGKLINPDSSRVVNLTFNGKPLDPKQEFIVVSNNYRAYGGGNFPNLTAKGENVIYDSPDENRQALIMYIQELGEINPSADNNWSIAPISEDVNVTFLSSPNAKSFADQTSHIKYVDTLESGFAKFALDLKAVTEVPVVSFPDVKEGHWAKSYVESLATRGIIKGKSDGSFGSSDQLTRAQFVVLLSRALELETAKEYAGTFKDVKGTEWFNENGELVAAVEAGIIEGKKDGTFAPNAPITRAQAASMMHRAMKHENFDASKLADTKLSFFADADKIQAGVKADVETVLQAGIMTGDKDQKFNPSQTLSRAQMSKMVYTFLEFLNK